MLKSLSLLALALTSMTAYATGPAPGDIRCRKDSSAPRRMGEVLAAGVGYPESPLRARGRTLFVEYSTHRLSRIARDGGVETVWEQAGCGPSGVAYAGGRKGRYFVTCYDSRALVEISADGRATRTHAADVDGRKFTGPNDLVADGRGGFYFTDSGSGGFVLGAPSDGAVYRIDAAGAIRQVASGLHYANGVLMIENGMSLLVSEHLANRVVKFGIHADGTLDAAPTVFVDLAASAHAVTDSAAGLQGPDGIRPSRPGYLWVAQYGGSRYIELSESGEWTREVRIRSRFPNTDNSYFTRGGRGSSLYFSAVEETADAPYPGIIGRIDLPRGRWTKLECEL